MYDHVLILDWLSASGDEVVLDPAWKVLRDTCMMAVHGEAKTRVK